MNKSGALNPDTLLQPHQQALFDEAKQHPIKKLLMHQLGSGKTLSSLAIAEALGGPYTAVVPASLRENFKKEQQKFTDQTTPNDVISYSQIARGAPITKLDTLIGDEVHRLRNPKSIPTRRLTEISPHVKQLVLLSGTPIVNRPGDIAPLVDMLTGHKFSPEKFEDRYVQEKKVQPNFFAKMMGVKPGIEEDLNRENELRSLLRGHIDYYAPEGGNTPVKFQDIETEMSPDQFKLYRAMFDKLPWTLRYKLKNDFPLTKDEFRKLRSFMVGPRQVGLSTMPFMRYKSPNKAFLNSPKLQKAFGELKEKLKDERTKALIFSNFISAGLEPYSEALTRAGIPNALFHGGLNDKQRKELVDNYNRNKLRVALLGPSGAEGLSFRGTQLIQILDPHWHNVRTKQQEGRGLRFDSHLGLPEDLQNVTIQRFIAKLPLNLRDRLLQRLGIDRSSSRIAADDILRQMANRKENLNNKFINLLKDIGSEPHRKIADAIILGSQPHIIPKPTVLDRLKEAKRHSDVKNWAMKQKIIRELMLESPNHWHVDETPGPIVGIRHLGTNFQFHIPRSIIPPEVFSQIRHRKADRIEMLPL